MITTVRAAQLPDAEAIARVRVAGWRAAYRGILADEVLDNMEPTVQPRLRQQLVEPLPGQSFLVCESEGVVLGFANCGPYRVDQDRNKIDAAQGGELYAIYVDPKAWGSGCGTVLVAAVEEFLVQQSFRQCRLWTLERNAQACRFYRNRGYEFDGGRLDYIAADGRPVPEVRFRKLLGPRTATRR